MSYSIISVTFDSFSLPIIIVVTDDLELIDDMFSRLNEAVPLNAAEKRNAIGGPLAKAIREVTKHEFFANKIKINNRYQHREVAARLLMIEWSLYFYQRILDTKKPYLDNLVRLYKTESMLDVKDIIRPLKK